MNSLTATALEIARTQTHVREKGGKNTGPEVDLYLAAVGLGNGFPWCAAFLYWCFERAANRLGLHNPFPHTASSQAVWRRAEPICREPNPSPGFVYVLQHGANTGHVGIVESVTDGIIAEVSGNTFDGRGGREGNAVARHTGQPEVVHGPALLLGYLDFDKAAQAPSVVA